MSRTISAGRCSLITCGSSWNSFKIAGSEGAGTLIQMISHDASLYSKGSFVDNFILHYGKT